MTAPHQEIIEQKPKIGSKLFRQMSQLPETSASWTLFAKWPKDFAPLTIVATGRTRHDVAGNHR